MGQNTHNHWKNIGSRKHRKGRRRIRNARESNLVDGGFSQLPEGIQHRILSFLPLDDAIKTCVLSKAWERAWCSTPFLRFDFFFLYYEKNMNWILEFVDDILSRREIDAGITRFRLDMPYELRWNPIIESWMNFVANNNVKELYLKNEADRFLLPPTFFNFRSLTVLKIEECHFLEPPTSICLPLLKKLSLILVYIYDHSLDILLAACPSIETFILKICHCISSIQISSSTLKFVELFQRHSMNIDIKADHLQSFRYYHEECDNTYCLDDPELNLSVQIEIGFWQALKVLSLQNVPIADDELEHLVCHLSLLERLVLNGSETLKHVRIISAPLKSIFIFRSDTIDKIDLNTPNLFRLTYHGVLLSSFFMISPNLWEANIKLKDPICLKQKWYAELSCFLGLFDHAKILKLTCSAEALLFPKELRTGFSPLKEIKHLELNLIESTLYKSKLRSTLIWLFPSLKTLSVNLEFIKKYFKFECGTTTQRAKMRKALETNL